MGNTLTVKRNQWGGGKFSGLKPVPVLQLQIFMHIKEDLTKSIAHRKGEWVNQGNNYSHWNSMGVWKINAAF